MSWIDEKSNGEKNELRNTQSTSLMAGLADLKREEDVGQLNNTDNDTKSTINNIETTKETQNSETILENRDIEAFGSGVPLKVVKNDPAVTDAGPSSFLYRSPYAQTATGFPSYPYPVPPIDSKDKQLSPSTLNNKMTVPLLPISSGSKDLLQSSKTDKNSSSLSFNPPKERDNFRYFFFCF